MKFAILASPHTGSSSFISRLNNHPEICCHSEIFHPKAINLAIMSTVDRGSLLEHRPELGEMQNSDPIRFLGEIYAINDGKMFVYYNIFPGHNETILNYIVDAPDTKKIILYRDNILSVHSSGLITSKTVVWNQKESSKQIEKELPRIIFNKDRFREFEEKYNEFYANILDRLGKDGQSFHFIRYEEIESRYLIANCLNFLGADPRITVTSLYAKQNSSSIVERFANAEVVHAFLQRTGRMGWSYEGMVRIGAGDHASVPERVES